MDVKLSLWHYGEKTELRISENRAMTRTSGPKRDEITEGWMNLHNEEQLRNLYSLPRMTAYWV
jgi:hypothetical protein